MSLTQPDTQEDSTLPSAGLNLNLNSNNPFRNRATSPPQLSPGQLSPVIPRPVSRNPFIDASEATPATATSPTMPAANGVLAPKTFVPGEAAELFDSLTLNDKPQGSSNVTRPVAPRSTTTDKNSTAPPRSENIPPRGPPRHRPTRSQEDALRARRAAAGGERRGSKGESNVFADPNNSPRRSGERRPRRNSESSVLENGQKKPVDPEEEKKRQERRRKDRERRHRERDAKNKKPDRKLDVIDQLDATSIYGAGLFHHDGPFDACNPHRNRQGSRRAPMQAFPKDSLNNVLGGGGPLNKRPDHAAFLGNNNVEAFKDYARSGEGGANYESYNGGKTMQPTVLSPLQRVEPIHGEESLGLGTSTFLEGAPASRNAIQRRNTETEPDLVGINRKKSLAQKIRGISNNNRRDYPGSNGRIMNPDSAQNITSPRSPDYTPGGTKHNSTEKNPFFTEFKKNSFEEERRDGKDGKQGENITIVEPENKPETAKTPGSPVFPGSVLERRVTGDGNSEEAKTGGMGFLSRVKSLKTGGRRAPPPRPERPAN